MHDLSAPQAGDPRIAGTQQPPHPLSEVLMRLAAPAGSPLPLPRLLVVLAHPDDEVLAMGARLERLAGSRLLTVTDGAPTNGADARHHGFPSLDAYRGAREAELSAALAHAGASLQAISPARPAPFPVADQTAALHLPALTRAVAQAIRDFAPEAVLTHPYEGGHPDHDACAFAVSTAVRWLEDESVSGPRDHRTIPAVVEAPFYHAAANGSMETSAFLACDPSAEPLVCELSPAEQANKRARLACFRSQTETLAQFRTDRELFRIAPVYDFTQPPHPGQLFYQRFPWGMTPEQFRALAAEAVEELFGSPNARLNLSAAPEIVPEPFSGSRR